MTTRSMLSLLSRTLAARSAWPPQLRAGLGAVALTLGASALFALQGALVKTGVQDLPALELVFFRGFVCALVLLVYARVRGLSLASPRPASQVAFGIVSFVSLALYFTSIGMLPLVTASALNYTAPLFIALVVGMQAGRRSAAALLWIAAGFAGVCLVLQPSFSDGSTAGVKLGLASGLTGAAAYLLLGRLGHAGEPQRVTAFYYSVVVLTLAGIPTLARGGFSVATWDQAGLVLAIGLLATVAQLAVFKAYAISTPLIPSTVSYSVVIFSSLIGAWLWGDQLGFSEGLGIALIVASGILVSAAQAAPAPAGAPVSAQERRRTRENRVHNLRSAYAAYKLAMDPRQTRYAFMISAAQDTIAEGERARGRILDPFASEALEQMWQSRFRAGHYDVEALARLPAHTLGGAYARHMKAHNLRPDFYKTAEPRHRMNYLRLRLRQTHDVWHVLTGFGIDEYGEIGLQGFYFGQFTSGYAALIGAAFILRSLLRGRLAEVEKLVDAFCEGYCNGKRAEPLLAVKWEELWGESMESLRLEYGIAAGITAARGARRSLRP